MPPEVKSSQQWVQERKEIALRQLSRVPELTKALFEKQDLEGFLSLLSRLPCYSYINLLIIYEKYPAATNLAGFSAWQQLLAGQGSTQKVLKPEAMRNGIDLVAPFTNVVGEKEFELTWFSPLVFDVKQTNVTEAPSRPSAYCVDALHQPILADAVADTLGTHYGHRVIFEPRPEPLRACGRLGRISTHTVSVLKEAKEEKAFFWLTEALCSLAANKADLSDASNRFLQQCVHACLYKTWNLPHSGLLPGSHLDVPEGEREAVLDALQRTVFLLHQQISGAYLSHRKEDQALQEDLPERLL